jgi:cell division cycle protein 20 (cofactor of APC complex)
VQIAVALGPTVYLWNASTGSVEELCSLKNEGDYVTSVAWAADSTHIAVGTSDAKVQVRLPSFKTQQYPLQHNLRGQSGV